jgi:2-amino-4-hydroxy-6-hydroxymethyldihydropteridine diphosphokinase
MARDLDEAVIVALGSNLQGAFDSSRSLLEAALIRFASAGVAVMARSSWWTSAAWPDATGPTFVNGVALVQTTLPARSLLAFLAGLEASFGRVRGAANAPRTLDLDLIAYGRLVISVAGLELPHPRARQRRFVMGPLAEVAAAWLHPVTGERADKLAAKASVGRDALRLRRQES